MLKVAACQFRHPVIALILVKSGNGLLHAASLAYVRFGIAILTTHIYCINIQYMSDYAELHCLSCYSFLRSASHPHELVERAAKLGYTALAITDALF